MAHEVSADALYKSELQIRRICEQFTEGGPIVLIDEQPDGVKRVLKKMRKSSSENGTITGNLHVEGDSAAEYSNYAAWANRRWYYLPEAEYERWRKGALTKEEAAKIREETPALGKARHAALSVIGEGDTLHLTALGWQREHCFGTAFTVTRIAAVDKDSKGQIKNLTVDAINPFTQLERFMLINSDGWTLCPDMTEAPEIVQESEAATKVATKGKKMSSKFSETLEVAREGKAIVVPDGITLDKAIETLQRRKRYEEEETQIEEAVECFPWEGAYLLNKAMQKFYGWATAEPIPGFFGPTPPKLIAVDIAHGETVNVPWGRFSLPNVTGWIQTGTTQLRGRIVFAINALVKRKHEKDIKELADEVRRMAKEESLYRGKALKIKFYEDNGERIELPMPKFLNVTNATEDRLIFTEEVQDAVRTNLFTPIERYRAVKGKRLGLADIKTPFKRGILLCGTYGTGKTELAFTAANKAEQNGITFLYVESAKEFVDAVKFVALYPPAVVFVEDIERVMGGDTRTTALDEVLNTIDGLEAKGSEVFVILTSNHPESITPAMMRPGRIDCAIEVKRPDSNAVEKLVRLYAGKMLAPDADIAEACRLLNGNIPAVIAEVVQRSKLAALRTTPDGEMKVVINGENIVEAARTMRMQLDLLNRRQEPTPTDFEKMGRAIGGSIREGIKLLKMASDPSRTFVEVKEGDECPHIEEMVDNGRAVKVEVTADEALQAAQMFGVAKNK